MRAIETLRFDPTRIAPDTYLIHDHVGEGDDWVSLNSMVIRGREPVVVDTGIVDNREQFLTDVFSLVDPEDVRWVFISHDDVDHTGNVNVLMDACPNATLVIDWFMQERMGGTLEVPPTRWRWLHDGESLDVGDRTLHLVRPPIFDSPTSRGLFDPSTGVYWSSDSFGTDLPGPVRDIAALDNDAWIEGMHVLNNWVSPWLRVADDRRFQATVDRIEALNPTTIVGCHTPVIDESHVATAIATTRRSPITPVVAYPDQSVLDQIIAGLEADVA